MCIRDVALNTGVNLGKVSDDFKINVKQGHLKQRYA